LNEQMANPKATGFPAIPDARGREPRRYFSINDPFGLRQAVAPVIGIQLSTGLVSGLGTALLAGQYRLGFTALHLIEDQVSIRMRESAEKEVLLQFSLLPDRAIFALKSPGIGFGQTRLARDRFMAQQNPQALFHAWDAPDAVLTGRPFKLKYAMDLVICQIDMPPEDFGPVYKIQTTPDVVSEGDDLLGRVVR
jgi:hypothetical protein